MPRRLREPRACGGRRAARLKIDPAVEYQIYRTIPHDMMRHLAQLRVPAAFIGGARLGRRAPGAPRAHEAEIPHVQGAGRASLSSGRARRLRRSPRRWTSLQLLLESLDVHLDAQHVRVHIEGAAVPLERFVPLLELEVIWPIPERAEVTRIALQHFVAVGDRLVELAGEVVDRRAAVPALGEPGFSRSSVNTETASA